MLKKITTVLWLTCCVWHSHAQLPKVEQELITTVLEELSREEVVELIHRTHTYFHDSTTRIEEYLKDLSIFYRPYDDRQSSGEIPAEPWLQPLSDREAWKIQHRFLSRLLFSQQLGIPVSEIKLDISPRTGFLPDEEATYTLQKIWFADGTTEDCSLSLKGPERWDGNLLPTNRMIDSVQVNISYSYPTAYDYYPVADTLEIQGGSIAIREMAEHLLRVELKGSANEFDEIVALDRYGYPLRKGAHRVLPADLTQRVAPFVEALEKLEQQAEQGASTEQLKKSLAETLAQTPQISQTDHQVYLGVYRGEVHTIRVYFAEKTEVCKEVILPNIRKPDLPVYLSWDWESGKQGFVNASGEWVIPAVYAKISPLETSSYISDYLDLEPQNDYYYRVRNEQEEEQIWLLDPQRLEFTPVPGIQEAYAVSPTCIAVKADGKVALWNHEGRAVTEAIYDVIFPFSEEELLGVRQGNTYGLIRPTGETVIPAVASEITDFSEGVAVCKEEGIYHFLLNREGKLIDTAYPYYYWGPSSCGLLRAEWEDMYGFVNHRGEVALPFIYDFALDFSPAGVAVVRYQGKYGIINTAGEFIVPPTAAHYDLRSNGFDEPEYSLDGVVYDMYGDRIGRDEWWEDADL